MADKKQRYIILTATDVTVLERHINQKIDEGYAPHGNLVIANEKDVSGLVYFQPVVLRKTE